MLSLAVAEQQFDRWYRNLPPDRPARVGLFGGSFDPPHIGHLAVALDVREQLQLDRLVLIPAAQQPFKLNQHAATAAERWHMVQLACQEAPELSCWDGELHRPPPSYSIETVRHARQLLPSDCQLWWVLGADALAGLPRWQQAAELLQLCRLAVVARPGYQSDLQALEAALPGCSAQLDWISGPALELSSSMLRERLANGQTTRYLLPETVRKHLLRHPLYRPTSPEESV